MSILVQVKEGEIQVVEARDERPSTFRKEPEAAQHIAERVARTNAPVTFHLSCQYPAEYGRPGFSKPAFVEEVQDRIFTIQQAERGSHAPM
jgi:hypothetical protein